MSRRVRIFEGVALGFLDIQKLRPRLEVIPASTATIRIFDVKARASVGKVTERLKLDQPV